MAYYQVHNQRQNMDNKSCVNAVTNKGCNEKNTQSCGCNTEYLDKALMHLRKAEECIEYAMKRTDKCDK